MPEVTFREPYHSHGFVIEIAGQRCGVTKVTGLSEGHMDIMEFSMAAPCTSTRPPVAW